MFYNPYFLYYGSTVTTPLYNPWLVYRQPLPTYVPGPFGPLFVGYRS